MSENDIHVVIITCLETWLVDAIVSVNEQELAPEKKHLLVDERFLTEEGQLFLESLKDVLSGWEIHIHNLDNDFAKHKNWLLDRLPCKGEWVLSLDADETIDKGFVAAAKDLISYSDRYSATKVDAYSLAMIHSFDGREGDFVIDWLNPGTFLYPDWHIKLFKNTKALRYVGLVHEVFNGYKVVVPISDPKMTILHRKNHEMQDASNKRWRKLEVLRREKDPGYLSHLQGEDWKNFANAFEENIVD